MSKASLRTSKKKSTAPATSERGLAAGSSLVETAQYIAEFTAELSFLARRSNLDLLAYLLDMARLEATRSVQSSKRER
ncbi:hypothetical protein [Microvirga rosea]|uniref:hypothetical protein n=1 Tax=Microvirga rosea TaxID=2715425 RepID=UPI001D0A5FD2|nr:hypothetical protein [Microvirga rosea]MCB8820994.1 hypothetical protein [Microvirga rosea]